MDPTYYTLSVVTLPFEQNYANPLANGDQKSIDVTIKVRTTAQEVFQFKAYVENIEIGFMSIAMKRGEDRDIIRIDNYTKKKSYLLKGKVKEVGTTLVEYGLALNCYRGPQKIFAEVREEAVEFFKKKGFIQGEKVQGDPDYYQHYEPICFKMWRTAESCDESLKTQLDTKIKEFARLLG
jgi:hypothetical protein